MGRNSQLLDHRGNPVERKALVEPINAPTVGSVRAPIVGNPGDGLTPLSLATMLREADMGSPNRYLELAEVIEERDPHYLGVLSTRKRSVSQLDITVKAASNSPEDEARAELIRDWLDRDELTDELFHILDAIGKGYSITEIEWSKEGGKWWPRKLDRRDQKGFRFDRRDLQTPLELTDSGQERPLEPFRFIFAKMQAKSGLPLRSGLARVATWGWLFKAFTLRDWAIFTQTYGQPLRVGKWGTGASEDDKDTLFQAVANIAGDCAAIIPASMEIDFVETSNVGASTDLYLKRADWLDQQISKAVVGQTATTDAVTGGLGSGKEHRQVQEDIERADAKALQAILNRDLIRPWMDLEYGQLRRYPKLIIGRPEAEDLKLLSDALPKLVDMGMKVSVPEVRTKFSLSEPKEGDEILMPTAVLARQPSAAPPNGGGNGAESEIEYPFNTLWGGSRALMASQAQRPPAALSGDVPPEQLLADQLAKEADPAMRAILEQIETMLEASNSFDEFREMLANGFPELDGAALTETLSLAMSSAVLAGRVAVAESDDD